jgi:hypothetical protein
MELTIKMISLVTRSALPLILLVATIQPVAAKLAPHRAVYDLQSENVNRKSGIISVEGRLAYELTGSVCDGWSVTYRFANRYVRAEGVTQVTDSQLTSWEAGDGTEVQVNEKQYVDQSLSEETSLSARKEVGKEGKVRITKPSEKELSLPPGTLFSAEAQVRILDQAAKGETRLSETVFEGSDEDGIYRTISLVGPRRDGTKPGTKENGIEAMRKMPSWPVTASYYAVADDKSELPVYQTSYVMFENGVTTELLFDYGDYQLRGKMTSLELLPQEPCEQ